jgi:hypothetical protein
VLSAYDESFYGFSIPFSIFCACVCEILYLLNSVESYSWSFDETPFVGEGVYDVGWECFEFFRADVETV